MKKYMITLNDKVYKVDLEEIEEASSEEATTITQSSKPVITNDSEQSSRETKVEAPMPGTILGIAVKVGDQVKKDQVLIILEAMKMENEIVSPLDGKIVTLGVSKGDSVTVGQVLVQIG